MAGPGLTDPFLSADEVARVRRLGAPPSLCDSHEALRAEIERLRAKPSQYDEATADNVIALTRTIGRQQAELDALRAAAREVVSDAPDGPVADDGGCRICGWVGSHNPQCSWTSLTGVFAGNDRGRVVIYVDPDADAGIAPNTGVTVRAAALTPCPSGCGCVTAEDPDRRDCACDGPCCMSENWPLRAAAPASEDDEPNPVEIVATFLLEGRLRGGETEARMQYKASRIVAALRPVLAAEQARYVRAAGSPPPTPTREQVHDAIADALSEHVWAHGTGEIDGDGITEAADAVMALLPQPAPPLWTGETLHIWAATNLPDQSHIPNLPVPPGTVVEVREKPC